MLFHASSWKKKTFSYLFSHSFFKIMLENAAPPLWKSSSSMENFPHIAPSSQPPPPNRKIPLKTSLHFPITINICKHWSKFATCSPSHGDCGWVSRPQRHSYKVFRLCWIKWLSQNFDPTTLGKKWAWEGSRCLPSFLVT